MSVPPHLAPAARPPAPAGAAPPRRAGRGSSPPDPAAAARTTRAGVAYAAAAFLWWGLAPVYWKAVGSVPPENMIAWRVLFALAVLGGLFALRPGGLAAGRRQLGAAFGAPRTRRTLALSAALLAVNWYTYIWAMGAERVLEASLGYYVNPLVNVLLGIVFLGERLRRPQGIAVVLAAAGVAVLTAEVGRIPWVALVLAGTFGVYGLLRKTVDAGPEVGLAVETILLAPLAALHLGVLASRGAAGGHPPLLWLLIAAAGLITVAPLVWFAHGARRLTLATLGLLQYLAPTGQFLLAVLLYREPFTAAHLAAFALIWTGLAVFTWDLRRRVAGRPAAA